MDQPTESVETAGSPTVLHPVPDRWTPVWLLVSLAMTVAVAALAMTSGSWVFVPMLLLGPWFLVQHLVATLSSVELDDRGMVVHHLLGQRTVRWADVEEMTIDPPGGPRLVRYRTGGHDRFLSAELADDGGFVVLDAYRRAGRDR